MVPELEKPNVTEIQVRIDCNGCVHKIKKALHGINGIYDIYIDMPQQKLTVIGWADPEKIVKAIKKTRKTATICSHMESEPSPEDGEPSSDGPANLPGEEAPPLEPPDALAAPPPTGYTTYQPPQSIGLREVEVAYHRPPDHQDGAGVYSERVDYYPGGGSGHGSLGFTHELPQPSRVNHSYNSYNSTPYVTEYEYIRPPSDYMPYSRPEPPQPRRYTEYSWPEPPQAYKHYSRSEPGPPHRQPVPPQNYSQPEPPEYYRQPGPPQNYSQPEPPQHYRQPGQSQNYRQPDPPQHYRQPGPPQNYSQPEPPQHHRQPEPPQHYSQPEPPPHHRQHRPPQQQNQTNPPQQLRRPTPPRHYRRPESPQRYRQPEPPQQYPQHSLPESTRRPEPPQPYTMYNRPEPQQNYTEYHRQEPPQNYTDYNRPEPPQNHREYHHPEPPQQYTQASRVEPSPLYTYYSRLEPPDYMHHDDDYHNSTMNDESTSAFDDEDPNGCRIV